MRNKVRYLLILSLSKRNSKNLLTKQSHLNLNSHLKVRLIKDHSRKRNSTKQMLRVSLIGRGKKGSLLGQMFNISLKNKLRIRKLMLSSQRYLLVSPSKTYLSMISSNKSLKRTNLRSSPPFRRKQYL
jgi:hypothetical protein